MASAQAAGRPQAKDFSVAGDPARVLRAVATNQLARVAPGLYVRLTRQTGRGAAAEEGASDIVQYFRDCVDAYFERLRVPSADVPAYLDGRTLMEYGPGDFPGVAALMVARGARKVYCVDRFPLVNLNPKNARVLAGLINGCRGVECDRLVGCLANPDDLAAGLAPERIEYLVRPSGLSRLQSAVDMVFSRAVLEHVNDLEATFSDMVAALRPGAVAIHQVDLRSLGLHKANPLDFLAWSPRLWHWMYSEKGVPNRWRVDKYRAVVDRLPVEVQTLEPTELASPECLVAARELLAEPYKGVSNQDLSWLGFWLVMRKRGP